MTTTDAKVRNTIRIDDTDVLTPGQITQAIADAITIIGSLTSDELAIRYKTCYLLARDISWDKVKSTHGINFETPTPEKFDMAYQARLQELGVNKAKPKKVNWDKVDTVQY